jgi:hypothetical protein
MDFGMPMSNGWWERIAKNGFKAVVIATIIVADGFSPAQACDDTCQTLRKAQDPLADVTAIMTDNTLSWGSLTSGDDVAHNYQLQPVKSFETKLGFNYIVRGVVPIIGVPQSFYLPYLGDNVGGNGTTWGLSDIVIQNFIVPQSDADFKFGFGPQFSLRTRTHEEVGGPGWGAGLAVVGFGFAGDFSYGGIIGHHWGQAGFNMTTIQPMIYYNSPRFVGSYLAYNNSITHDWSASNHGDAWQVPLGLTIGKTFLLDGGNSLDLNLGVYTVATGPVGAADTQFKFGVSWFFP